MDQQKRVRINLIGDIFPGELSYTQNYGIRSQFNRHKGGPWYEKIEKLLGQNDITIGNLESPLISASQAKKNTFFGEPDFAFFLKKCGINVINVANNHILEHGNSGFRSTVETLHKADLDIVGICNNEFGSVFCLKKVNNLNIAIAGFSSADLEEIRDNGHYCELTEKNIISTIKRMEDKRADLKILCFHWGNEYIHVPCINQRQLAYKSIDNGADVIVGHHPHVVQPYEVYKNGHIFYSLGNFIFDFIHSKMVSIGLVATLDVTDYNTINASIKGIELSYKNMIRPLNSLEFERYYSKVIRLYNRLLPLNDLDYQCRYSSMLKRNHVLQRLLMKTSLIPEFLRISKRDKIYLIKNLLKYYNDFIAVSLTRNSNGKE